LLLKYRILGQVVQGT